MSGFYGVVKVAAIGSLPVMVVPSAYSCAPARRAIRGRSIVTICEGSVPDDDGRGEGGAKLVDDVYAAGVSAIAMVALAASPRAYRDQSGSAYGS